LPEFIKNIFIYFTVLKFQVNNYHFWRADRTAYGGGIAAYVRSDLPCDRKKILEFKNIESICIEIFVGNKKWLISGVYRHADAPWR
jgi:hypothetical protein